MEDQTWGRERTRRVRAGQRLRAAHMLRVVLARHRARDGYADIWVPTLAALASCITQDNNRGIQKGQSQLSNYTDVSQLCSSNGQRDHQDGHTLEDTHLPGYRQKLSAIFTREASSRGQRPSLRLG